MDTGPVLALEPLRTILPGNYRHLQHLRALDRPTLFLTPFLHTILGDYFQEKSAPGINLLGPLVSWEHSHARKIILGGNFSQDESPGWKGFLGRESREKRVLGESS
jgi:hypothetical protein